MENAEQELAGIGFGRNRREDTYWRAVRIGGPMCSTDRAEAGPELACSRPLARWRELLAQGPVTALYRISRADD